MARIPLILPVSYPKRIPPNATKIPIKMAGRVFPSSPAGFLIMKPIVYVTAVASWFELSKENGGVGCCPPLLRCLTSW